MNTETLKIAEINSQGMKALTDWGRMTMNGDSVFADAVAADLAAEFEGSQIDTIGCDDVDIRGTKTISGNPETFSVDFGQLDIVTIDEDDCKLARQTWAR